jgi:hypothetical protein
MYVNCVAIYIFGWLCIGFALIVVGSYVDVQSSFLAVFPTPNIQMMPEAVQLQIVRRHMEDALAWKGLGFGIMLAAGGMGIGFFASHRLSTRRKCPSPEGRIRFSIRHTLIILGGLATLGFILFIYGTILDPFAIPFQDSGEMPAEVMAAYRERADVALAQKWMGVGALIAALFSMLGLLVFRGIVRRHVVQNDARNI